MIPETLKRKIEAEAIDISEGSLFFAYEVEPIITRGAELALEEAWVNVKDRMPEAGNKVLVFSQEEDDNPYITVATLDNSHDWVLPGTYVEIYGVSHWMPLPSPPPTK